MALVQCMDAKKHKTFGDLATDYCRPLTSCFVKAHTVADVFDRYDVKNSIKLAERASYQSDCPYKGVPSHRRQKYS